MRKVSAIVVAIGLLLACEQSAKEQNAVAAISAGKVTKRALLVGINRYRYPNIVPTLSGSVNDVEDMKALLIGKFDFAPENIQVLTDERATHAGIIGAIENLITRTQEGDVVVFHYSGHGSQMKDVTGESPSGLDETLVPYDSRDPANKVFDISGTELKPFFRRLGGKTNNFLVILDSCHSGSFVKGPRVRRIPPDQRQLPTRSGTANAGVGVNFSPSFQGRFMYALIAAASSREVAFEHFGGGKDRGALTYFLTRELRAAHGAVTYKDVMDAVTGNVTAHHPSQHPQLEGLQADQYVFGDTESLAQPYVLVSPAGTGRVSLASGQVQGITVGSIFDIYAPGTKKFEDPQKPVAKVEIIEVKPLTAVGKLISGTNVPNFSRAVEREHNYRDMQLLVYFQPELIALQTVRPVRDAIAGFKHVQVVTDPNIAHLQLRRDLDELIISGVEENSISPPVKLNDPDFESKVTGQIDQWARWFNVLSIRNIAPTISADVQIKTTKDGKTKDVFAQIGPVGPRVFAGEDIEVTVNNKSRKDLYFVLLDLQTDGSIKLLYPKNGTHEVLRAGSSFSKSWTASLSGPRKEIIDVVMLLASVQQFDADGITRPPVRAPRASTEPIGKLLDLARGVTPVSSGATPNLSGATSSTGPISAGEWITDQRVLKVLSN